MIYIVHIESMNDINLLYIYNIPERGGNKASSRCRSSVPFLSHVCMTSSGVFWSALQQMCLLCLLSVSVGVMLLRAVAGEAYSSQVLWGGHPVVFCLFRPFPPQRLHTLFFDHAGEATVVAAAAAVARRKTVRVQHLNPLRVKKGSGERTQPHPVVSCRRTSHCQLRSAATVAAATARASSSWRPREPRTDVAVVRSVLLDDPRTPL